MEDPGKRDLKKLINSYCFFQQCYKFNMQQINCEDRRLHKSIINSETPHKKIEHLEKLRDFQNLLNETQRQMKKVQFAIQTFLDLNADLQNTKDSQEATRLIEEQNGLEKKILNANMFQVGVLET
uniref:Uncharacterized protein LOC108053522 n=1 Tax=Drosophila rhopaloa TaxID=1041015 RepID=A0A6P4FW40_DRORH